MARKQTTTPAELNRLIGIGLKETGLVRAMDVAKSSHRIEGRSLSSLYQTLAKQKGELKFNGHPNWYAYLEAVHGIKRPSEKRTHLKSSKPLSKLSDDQLNELVGKGLRILEPLERQKSNAAKNWHSSKEMIEDHARADIYNEIVRRNSFLNCKTWDAYLEKHHEMVPLDQNHWSDERFHRTIAVLAEKYPPEKIKWRINEKRLPGGISLLNLYMTASKSKRPQKERHYWFDHPSFKHYAKWAVENYGSKSEYYRKAERGEK